MKYNQDELEKKLPEAFIAEVKSRIPNVNMNINHLTRETQEGPRSPLSDISLLYENLKNTNRQAWLSEQHDVKPVPAAIAFNKEQQRFTLFGFGKPKPPSPVLQEKSSAIPEKNDSKGFKNS